LPRSVQKALIGTFVDLAFHLKATEYWRSDDESAIASGNKLQYQITKLQKVIGTC
jgi:hypothetical protein